MAEKLKSNEDLLRRKGGAWTAHPALLTNGVTTRIHEG